VTTSLIAPVIPSAARPAGRARGGPGAARTLPRRSRRSPASRTRSRWLGKVISMAERDQVTGAAAGLAGLGLPAGCGQMPVLARRVGQSLVDAGFSLHRCSPRDPLGGVCLTPVPRSGGAPSPRPLTPQDAERLRPFFAAHRRLRQLITELEAISFRTRRTPRTTQNAGRSARVSRDQALADIP